ETISPKPAIFSHPRPVRSPTPRAGVRVTTPTSHSLRLAETATAPLVIAVARNRAAVPADPLSPTRTATPPARTDDQSPCACLWQRISRASPTWRTHKQDTAP